MAVMEWFIIIVLLIIIILLLVRRGGDAREKIQREAEKQFQEWMDEEVPIIRKEAIRSSQAVTKGKSLEQLIPYFPDFPYNPKDVRFLGSPIDLVVFDGLSEGDLREVIFIEVKTGKTPALPIREKLIKECITRRRVSWHLLHYKS